MRETLEAVAAALIIILQIINVILSKGMVKKVEESEENTRQLRRMWERK